MKVYHGLISLDATYIVVVQEGTAQRLLDPRLDLWAHSPTGFCWGYGGSGPAQLALALCADAAQDDNLAVQCYQFVKRSRVAALPMERRWLLTHQDVCRDMLHALSLKTSGVIANHIPVLVSPRSPEDPNGR